MLEIPTMRGGEGEELGEEGKRREKTAVVHLLNTY